MAPVKNVSKKTIFLDYHPQIPNIFLKAAKPSKVSNTPEEQQESGAALLNWQLKWMNDYDAMRIELTNQVQEHQEEFVCLKRLIENQDKTSSKLEHIIELKNKKIGKLKTSLFENKKSKCNVSDVQTQTETNNDHYQMGKCGAMGCVSFECIRKIHSYARLVEPKSRKLHKCFNCAFFTHKKSTLDSHYEFCVPNTAKDVKCPICRKSFMYHRNTTRLAIIQLQMDMKITSRFNTKCYLNPSSCRKNS